MGHSNIENQKNENHLNCYEIIPPIKTYIQNVELESNVVILCNQINKIPDFSHRVANVLCLEPHFLEFYTDFILKICYLPKSLLINPFRSPYVGFCNIPIILSSFFQYCVNLFFFVFGKCLISRGM